MSVDVFAELVAGLELAPPTVCEAVILPEGRQCDREMTHAGASWCGEGCRRDFLVCAPCATVIASQGNRLYCLAHPGAVLFVSGWRPA